MEHLKQSMQMKTGQLLSKRMLKKIKMLELSYPQFIESIQKKVEENPLLEIEETSTDADFFSLNNPANYYQDRKNPHDVLSETLTKKESLFDALKNQLDFSYDQDDPQYQIGLSVISSLDQDGLLPPSKKENLIKQFSKEKLQQVVEKIKTFQPTGVASSSVKECLLAQLSELEREKKISLPLEKKIVEHHLAELKNKEVLAKKLGVDEIKLQQAIEQIAYLNPKPGAIYSSFQPQIVVPEVVVKLVDHNSKIKIEIKESIFPKIKINKKLSEIIEKGKRAKTEFEMQIRKHREDADNTIDMMEYRKSTLKKTMERLSDVQRDFFFKGLQALKPYTITELAKDIGVNVSTASRLVNAKFIETPLGVFPLKIFFSSSKIPHTTSDSAKIKKEVVSAQHIKQMIKKIIEEAHGERLSDQRLCDILQRQGYTIARRTVNKYRHALETQALHN